MARKELITGLIIYSVWIVGLTCNSIDSGDEGIGLTVNHGSDGFTHLDVSNLESQNSLGTISLKLMDNSNSHGHMSGNVNEKLLNIFQSNSQPTSTKIIRKTVVNSSKHSPGNEVYRFPNRGGYLNRRFNVLNSRTRARTRTSNIRNNNGMAQRTTSQSQQVPRLSRTLIQNSRTSSNVPQRGSNMFLNNKLRTLTNIRKKQMSSNKVTTNRNDFYKPIYGAVKSITSNKTIKYSQNRKQHNIPSTTHSVHTSQHITNNQYRTINHFTQNWIKITVHNMYLLRNPNVKIVKVGENIYVKTKTPAEKAQPTNNSNRVPIQPKSMPTPTINRMIPQKQNTIISRNVNNPNNMPKLDPVKNVLNTPPVRKEPSKISTKIPTKTNRHISRQVNNSVTIIQKPQITTQLRKTLVKPVKTNPVKSFFIRTPSGKLIQVKTTSKTTHNRQASKPNETTKTSSSNIRNNVVPAVKVVTSTTNKITSKTLPEKSITANEPVRKTSVSKTNIHTTKTIVPQLNHSVQKKIINTISNIQTSSNNNLNVPTNSLSPKIISFAQRTSKTNSMQPNNPTQPNSTFNHQLPTVSRTATNAKKITTNMSPQTTQTNQIPDNMLRNSVNQNTIEKINSSPRLKKTSSTVTRAQNVHTTTNNQITSVKLPASTSNTNRFVTNITTKTNKSTPSNTVSNVLNTPVDKIAPSNRISTTLNIEAVKLNNKSALPAEPSQTNTNPVSTITFNPAKNFTNQVIIKLVPKDPTVLTNNIPVKTAVTNNVPVDPVATFNFPVDPVVSRNVPVDPVVTRNVPVDPVVTRNVPVDLVVTRNVPVDPVVTRNVAVVPVVTRNMPVDPVITRKVPVDPVATFNFPVDPVVTRNVQVDPVVTRNVPVDPVATFNFPVDPVVTRNVPVDPVATFNFPVDPVVTRNVPVDPVVTRNVPVDPVVTRNVPVDPVVTRNVPVDPVVTRNVPVDPVVTRNVPVDPVVTRNVTRNVPVDPVVTRNVPVDPVVPRNVPVDPVVPRNVPVDPVVTRNVPVDPVVTLNVPVDPVATFNFPVDPVVTRNFPVDPVLTQNVPVDPVLTRNVPVDPVLIRNVPVDLVVTNNVPSNPVVASDVSFAHVTNNATINVPVMKNNVPVNPAVTNNIPIVTNNVPIDPVVTNNVPVKHVLTSNVPVEHVLKNNVPVNPAVTNSINNVPVDPVVTSNIPFANVVTNNVPVDPVVTNNVPVDPIMNNNVPVVKIDPVVTNNAQINAPVVTNNVPVNLVVTNNATNNVPVHPVVRNNVPVDPIVTNNVPVDPVVINYVPVDPVVTNNVPVNHVVTNNVPVDPVVTNNVPVDPVVTNNVSVDPVVINNVLVDPVLTNNVPVDPVVTHNVHVEPAVTYHFPVDPVTNNVLFNPAVKNNAPVDPVVTKNVQVVVTNNVPVNSALTNNVPVDPVVTKNAPVGPVETNNVPVQVDPFLNNNAAVKLFVTNNIPVDHVVRHSAPVETVVTNNVPINQDVTTNVVVDHVVTNNDPVFPIHPNNTHVDPVVTSNILVQPVVTNTVPVDPNLYNKVAIDPVVTNTVPIDTVVINNVKPVPTTYNVPAQSVVTNNVPVNPVARNNVPVLLIQPHNVPVKAAVPVEPSMTKNVLIASVDPVLEITNKNSVSYTDPGDPGAPIIHKDPLTTTVTETFPKQPNVIINTGQLQPGGATGNAFVLQTAEVPFIQRQKDQLLALNTVADIVNNTTVNGSMSPPENQQSSVAVQPNVNQPPIATYPISRGPLEAPSKVQQQPVSPSLTTFSNLQPDHASKISLVSNTSEVVLKPDSTSRHNSATHTTYINKFTTVTSSPLADVFSVGQGTVFNPAALTVKATHSSVSNNQVTTSHSNHSTLLLQQHHNSSVPTVITTNNLEKSKLNVSNHDTSRFVNVLAHTPVNSSTNTNSINSNILDSLLKQGHQLDYILKHTRNVPVWHSYALSNGSMLTWITIDANSSTNQHVLDQTSNSRTTISTGADLGQFPTVIDPANPTGVFYHPTNAQPVAKAIGKSHASAAQGGEQTVFNETGLLIDPELVDLEPKADSKVINTSVSTAINDRTASNNASTSQVVETRPNEENIPTEAGEALVSEVGIVADQGPHLSSPLVDSPTPITEMTSSKSELELVKVHDYSTAINHNTVTATTPELKTNISQKNAGGGVINSLKNLIQRHPPITQIKKKYTSAEITNLSKVNPIRLLFTAPDPITTLPSISTTVIPAASTEVTTDTTIHNISTSNKRLHKDPVGRHTQTAISYNEPPLTITLGEADDDVSIPTTIQPSISQSFDSKEFSELRSILASNGIQTAEELNQLLKKKSDTESRQKLNSIAEHFTKTDNKCPSDKPCLWCRSSPAWSYVDGMSGWCMRNCKTQSCVHSRCKCKCVNADEFSTLLQTIASSDLRGK